MKRYKEDYEKELNVSIKPAESVKEAVDGKDMILTATQRLPEPLVKNEWFKPMVWRYHTRVR